ncbi:MAG: diguanylate cyclase [Cellulosilyticum sp.]|nr:diguanylate cyclase [Cellulosilyticum sp.]
MIDERGLDVDAIVCANDSMALTIINDLKKRDILIPEQIIVTGCDNIVTSAYCVPSLTTIEQSLEEMAQAAVKLLLKTIEGEKPENVVVPSKIIYRESCGCHIMPYSSLISALALPSSKDKIIQLTDSFLHKCTHTLPENVILLIRDFVIKCYSLVLSNTPTDFPPSQKVVKSFLTSMQPTFDSIQTVLNIKNCISSLKSDLLNLSQNTVTLCYIDHIFSQITHILLNQLLDHYNLQTERLTQDFGFTRQFLLTITHKISDKEHQLQSIIPLLMKTGIKSCLVYLYSEGVKHNLSDCWNMPNDIYLYMGYIQGKIIDPNTLPLKVDASDIAFYGFDERNENYVACIHPIFFSNEQLGVMVFEMDVDNYSLIDTLTVELGSALKLTSTFTLQKQVEDKLATLSQTDELTGLLNRRGFFNLAQSKYDASITNHEFGILFYADMDGLKTINDTYGHHEGDYAIITMSKILKQAFLNHDIIGRIGGDEFVILSINQSADYIEYVTEKVNLLCNEFNSSSNKPYTLSISIGSIFYCSDHHDSLENLLTKADQILYKQKKLKKKRKLRDA